MTIYVDSDYKCYTENAEGRTPIESAFFNEKCTAFIEGYRLVPDGQTWTREDGVTFFGEMITPWQNYGMLDAAQREYERQQLADYESALAEIETALGVNS